MLKMQDSWELIPKQDIYATLLGSENIAEENMERMAEKQSKVPQDAAFDVCPARVVRNSQQLCLDIGAIQDRPTH